MFAFECPHRSFPILRDSDDGFVLSRYRYVVDCLRVRFHFEHFVERGALEIQKR